MGNVPNRSPICFKALILKELRALPIGTPVIQFFWGTAADKPFKLRSVYQGLRQHPEKGACVVLVTRHPTYGVSEEVVPTADVGLTPYTGVWATRPCAYQGWNVSNVLVLPKDVNALPSGRTPQERLRRRS